MSRNITFFISLCKTDLLKNIVLIKLKIDTIHITAVVCMLMEIRRADKHIKSKLMFFIAIPINYTGIRKPQIIPVPKSNRIINLGIARRSEKRPENTISVLFCFNSSKTNNVILRGIIASRNLP